VPYTTAGGGGGGGCGGGLLKWFDRKQRTWGKKNSEGRNGNAMNFAMGYSLV